MSHIARAKRLLGKNPEKGAIHFTADHYPFFDKEKAESHASRLKNREVETITREEAEAYKEPKEEKPAATKKPPVKEAAKGKGAKKETATGKENGKPAEGDAKEAEEEKK